jgi:hypothetical protein
MVSAAGLFFNLKRLFSLGENSPYENVRMIKADNLGFFFYIILSPIPIVPELRLLFCPSYSPMPIFQRLMQKRELRRKIF